MNKNYRIIEETITYSCRSSSSADIAFVGWTMLQRVSAFDAIFPSLGDANRTVIAVIGAFILGVAATLLAYKADQNPG